MKEAAERAKHKPTSHMAFLKHSGQVWCKTSLSSARKQSICDMCCSQIWTETQSEVKTRQQPHRDGKNRSRRNSPSIAYFISMAKRVHMISALILPIFNSWGNLNVNKTQTLLQQYSYAFIITPSWSSSPCLDLGVPHIFSNEFKLITLKMRHLFYI